MTNFRWRCRAGRKRIGRKTLWVAGTALMLVGVGSVLAWRWLHPATAGHIDMVVSQIENTTKDADFDHTLDQALAIDLEQSPYLNLISAACGAGDADRDAERSGRRADTGASAGDLRTEQCRGGAGWDAVAAGQPVSADAACGQLRERQGIGRCEGRGWIEGSGAWGAGFGGGPGAPAVG